MALDHYVSQVYLRQFVCPDYEVLMRAIKKADQKAFPAHPKDVCRIEEGSTNEYLKDPRVIEAILETVEPKYGQVIERLKNGIIDDEAVYVISGFTAYVYGCSPAGMRIMSEPLRNSVKETARILDSMEKLPPSPKELGGKSLTELIEDETIAVDIDGKYPQAMGITGFFDLVSSFGNFRWEILTNPFEDSLFFTSDFPIALEPTDDPRVINKIVPLSPSLAVRIIPDISFDRKTIEGISFPNFKSGFRTLGRSEVEKINKLIVRCAESLVFYCRDYDWAPKFVKRNSKYRIEQFIQNMRIGDGVLEFYAQRVVETP